MWHFVADGLDKPLNHHLLEFANSIGTFLGCAMRHILCGFLPTLTDEFITSPA
jgi:hypothetical protein